MRFSSATLPTASSPGRSPRFWSPPSPRPRFLRQLAPQRERSRMLRAARHPEPRRLRPISRRFRLITSLTRCSDGTSRMPMLRRRTRGQRQAASRPVHRQRNPRSSRPHLPRETDRCAHRHFAAGCREAHRRYDESDEGGSGQGEGGSRCHAQGLGNSLLLSVLLDADRSLYRLRCGRNRRPATRSLKNSHRACGPRMSANQQSLEATGLARRCPACCGAYAASRPADYFLRTGDFCFSTSAGSTPEMTPSDSAASSAAAGTPTFPADTPAAPGSDGLSAESGTACTAAWKPILNEFHRRRAFSWTHHSDRARSGLG